MPSAGDWTDGARSAEARRSGAAAPRSAVARIPLARDVGVVIKVGRILGIGPGPRVNAARRAQDRDHEQCQGHGTSDPGHSAIPCLCGGWLRPPTIRSTAGLGSFEQTNRTGRPQGFPVAGAVPGVGIEVVGGGVVTGVVGLASGGGVTASGFWGGAFEDGGTIVPVEEG
jgi:hypothetical protein